MVNPSLTWAEGTYESMSGPIRSRWEREGDTLRLDVTIPANADAEVILPVGPGKAVYRGDSIAPAGMADGLARISIGSGEWKFIVR